MAYRQASAFVNQFFDTNGLPLSGGTIKSYLAGTTTTTAMYTDSSGTSAGGTITLNSRGEPEVSSNTVNIWLDEAINYKFVLADSAGASIWTVENINVGIASGALDILGAAPLINFKTSASESYDTRIAQLNNGLGFYTGGNGATVLGMLLDQNRNLLIDPAGAGGSPSVPLHIKGSTNDYPIKVESTDGTAGIQLADNATTGVVGVAAVGDNIALVGSKVGIGTTSPAQRLQVGSTNDSEAVIASFKNAGYSTFIEHDNSVSKIYGNSESKGLALGTNSVERMRIDSAGNLLISKTSTDLSVAGAFFHHSSVGYGRCNFISNTTPAYPLAFYYNGTTVGTVTTSTTSTAYTTSSDYRLKENIAEIENATDRLLKLKTYRFNFITDPEKTVDGFLAHEVQEVVPEAVTGEKDGMRTEEYEVTPAVLDNNGNVVDEAVIDEREVPDYQGIDQAKLVPLLVATVQEQQAKIDALIARVEQLET